MKIQKKFNLIIAISLAGFLLITVPLYFIGYNTFTGTKVIIFFTIGNIFILAVALIFIAIYVSKKIVRPINTIYRDSSKIIADGNFSSTITVKTGDEIEELADNFNGMAVVLQSRIDMLKKADEKEQHVIRSLAMLTEMMGFISSELKFEAVLNAFLEMTKTLLKAETSGIFIFEGVQNELKLFQATIKDTSPECGKAMLKGAVGDVLKTLTPIRINEYSAELPFNHAGIKNLVAVPLTMPDKGMSAVLVVVNKPDGFTQDDEETLFYFAAQAFHALVLHEEVAALAATDGLTGLHNHRTFQETLSTEVARAERYFKALSLIMIDIDHFKSFNDVYGHQTGDAVLKEIGRLVSKNIRNVDFAARYGGEEFVILLPETGFENAGIVAERIRQKVIEYPFDIGTSARVTLTISAGIACYPSDASTNEDLIKKADQALYFAKNHGRNRTCAYKETIPINAGEMHTEIANATESALLKGIEAASEGMGEKSYSSRSRSLETAAYSAMLGKQIKLEQTQIESLRVASMLHDMANTGIIPEYILNKPGPLTLEEKSIIQGHPGLAEMILKKQQQDIADVLPIILYHHERFDGKGYPRGLKAEEIPLTARVFAVVEAYQAMTSPRYYRAKMSQEEAMGELKKEAGSQFDPMVVNAFINLLKQRKP